MVRRHGDLRNDAETNEAAWEAARGATWGATKVRVLSFLFLGLHHINSTMQISI